MADRQMRDALTNPRELNPSSVASTYDVFISHVDEDKATIAIPLREKLAAHGITAFVNEEDLQPGTAAEEAVVLAMETAKVGVLVLSPEFVARKWTMRELMCFFRRHEETPEETGCRPVILPLFYRLSAAELHDEPRLDRMDKDRNPLYLESRFLERMQDGEPEANIAGIKVALAKLHGVMGVRNEVRATNDTTHVMSQKRETLIQALCEKVVEAAAKEPVQGNANVAEA